MYRQSEREKKREIGDILIKYLHEKKYIIIFAVVLMTIYLKTNKNYSLSEHHYFNKK